MAHWTDWQIPDRSDLALVPIFGCRTYGADTRCDDIHHGPIPHGSRCCCMVCHRSGLDASPAVYAHRKLGDGQTREGWEAGTPTSYRPGPLRGGK